MPINVNADCARLEGVEKDWRVFLRKTEAGVHIQAARTAPHRHLCRYRLGRLRQNKEVHVWLCHNAGQALHKALVLHAAERIAQQWRSCVLWSSPRRRPRPRLPSFVERSGCLSAAKGLDGLLSGPWALGKG